MRKSYAPWLLTGAALALVIAPPLTASTQRRPSAEELATEAEVIVVATCTQRQSEWHDGRLLTSVEVAVETQLKGPAAQTLSVVLPGGRDASLEPPLAEVGIGTPVLRAGEVYLLFLVPSSAVPGRWAVLGSAEGSFHLAPAQIQSGGSPPPGVPTSPQELLESVRWWIAASQTNGQG
ncbi:MAG TPA: hypothetical protein VF017_11065 [Thermoanaerobaculia bacterium]|nr:hypothetical protein [Thermoanaerobaculia bacterium]